MPGNRQKYTRANHGNKISEIRLFSNRNLPTLLGWVGVRYQQLQSTHKGENKKELKHKRNHTCAYTTGYIHNYYGSVTDALLKRLFLILLIQSDDSDWQFASMILFLYLKRVSCCCSLFEGSAKTQRGNIILFFYFLPLCHIAIDNTTETNSSTRLPSLSFWELSTKIKEANNQPEGKWHTAILYTSIHPSIVGQLKKGKERRSWQNPMRIMRYTHGMNNKSTHSTH